MGLMFRDGRYVNKSAEMHVGMCGQVARTSTLEAECQVHAESLSPVIEIVFYSNSGPLQKALSSRKEMSPTDTLIQTQ